nr:uncharacterized protein LOC119627904 [Chlorocebus sabaeus]
MFLSPFLLVGKAQFGLNRFGSGLSRLPGPRRQETTSPRHLPSQSGLSAGIHLVPLPTTPRHTWDRCEICCFSGAKMTRRTGGRPSHAHDSRSSQCPRARDPTSVYPSPRHRTCSQLRLVRSPWTPRETEIHRRADSPEGKKKKAEKRDWCLDDFPGKAGGKTPQQLGAGACAACAVRCTGSASLRIPPQSALRIHGLNSCSGTLQQPTPPSRSPSPRPGQRCSLERVT